MGVNSYLWGMSSYGDPKYWEKRYIKEEGERFDWLEDYGTLE